MSPRPGSFAWLVGHDLRLSWRGFDRAVGGLTKTKATLLIAGFLALHFAFWQALRFYGAGEPLERDSSLSRYIALGVLFVLPGVVAQAMTATTRALYAHGDLDVLFASPISARAVLGARAFAIAANAIAWFAIVLAPLANVNVLAGRLHWLAIYPALAACGLFGTGIGIVLSLALFAAFGPRRARLASQIGASIVGASFVVGLQGFTFVPGPARTALVNVIQAGGEGGWLDWHAWFSLPARAASGDGRALVLWTIVAVLVFILGTFVLGKRFAGAAIVSAGDPPASARLRKPRAFSASLGATMRAKERRLILRDPWLISQIVLQVVYMAPISFILWRNGGATGSPGIVFTPLIVVVGAQLAGSLAWIALSGEDAPDLLLAAPIAKRQIERHKVQAVLMPIALVLAAPIVALAFSSLWGAFCASFFTIGAGVSTALLNLWRQAPSRRGMVLHRHAQSKIVGMIEHLLSIVWAVGAVIAVMGHWSALVPVAFAGLILWLSRARNARVSLPASA